MKVRIISLFVCIIILFSASCASPKFDTLWDRTMKIEKQKLIDDKDKEFKGKFKDRKVSKITNTEVLAQTKKVLVTDAHVLDLTNDILKFFRDRFIAAGFARKITGSIQVISAAAAGLIGISEHEETELIAGLSGLSAIITPLQKIWKEGERAVAFQQGVSMIMEAENRYYTSIADNDKGVVSTEELSKEGAILFKEVTATLQVVTKTLAAQIPTIKELETATGKVAQDLSLKVVPINIKMAAPIGEREEDAAFIKVVNDRAIIAISDDTNVIKISQEDIDKFKEGKVLDWISLDSYGTGTAIISIFNTRGGRADVNVTVGTGEGTGAGAGAEDETGAEEGEGS